MVINMTAIVSQIIQCWDTIGSHVFPDKVGVADDAGDGDGGNQDG